MGLRTYVKSISEDIEEYLRVKVNSETHYRDSPRWFFFRIPPTRKKGRNDKDETPFLPHNGTEVLKLGGPHRHEVLCFWSLLRPTTSRVVRCPGLPYTPHVHTYYDIGPCTYGLFIIPNNNDGNSGL